MIPGIKTLLLVGALVYTGWRLALRSVTHLGDQITQSLDDLTEHDWYWGEDEWWKEKG